MTVWSDEKVTRERVGKPEAHELDMLLADRKALEEQTSKRATHILIALRRELC